MDEERLELAQPATRWEVEYLAFLDDFEAAGEAGIPGASGAQLARNDFAAFVQGMQADERGADLPPGIVPSSQFWLLRHDAVGATMVGVSSLRHALTPALEDVGGHIGYSTSAPPNGSVAMARASSRSRCSMPARWDFRACSSPVTPTTPDRRASL